MIHVAPNGYMPFVTGVPTARARKHKQRYGLVFKAEGVCHQSSTIDMPSVLCENLPRLSTDFPDNLRSEEKKQRGLLQLLFHLRRKVALPLTAGDSNTFPCKVAPNVKSQSPNPDVLMRTPVQRRYRRVYSATFTHTCNVLEAILEEEPDENLIIDDADIEKILVNLANNHRHIQ